MFLVAEIISLVNRRGFKFEVQQLMVFWCSIFSPRRIPHTGGEIQALF